MKNDFTHASRTSFSGLPNDGRLSLIFLRRRPLCYCLIFGTNDHTRFMMMIADGFYFLEPDFISAFSPASPSLIFLFLLLFLITNRILSHFDREEQDRRQRRSRPLRLGLDSSSSNSNENDRERERRDRERVLAREETQREQIETIVRSYIRAYCSRYREQILAEFPNGGGNLYTDPALFEQLVFETLEHVAGGSLQSLNSSQLSKILREVESHSQYSYLIGPNLQYQNNAIYNALVFTLRNFR